jgi:hypothetical protein
MHDGLEVHYTARGALLPRPGIYRIVAKVFNLRLRILR